MHTLYIHMLYMYRHRYLYINKIFEDLYEGQQFPVKSGPAYLSNIMSHLLFQTLSLLTLASFSSSTHLMFFLSGALYMFFFLPGKFFIPLLTN